MHMFLTAWILMGEEAQQEYLVSRNLKVRGYSEYQGDYPRFVEFAKV